jgi:hypothetical protein
VSILACLGIGPPIAGPASNWQGSTDEEFRGRPPFGAPGGTAILGALRPSGIVGQTQTVYFWSGSDRADDHNV